MVKSRTKFPREGEFIMGRVVEIQNQYIYVDLIDYKGLDSEEHARGMIHISEISSRWIKNIRNFARINQILVLRVLKVDSYKGHVDLSLRRVNSAQKENRKKEQKFAMKFETLLEFLSEETGMTLDEAYEKVGFPILDMYDNYQDAIEDLKENGPQILSKLNDIPEDVKQKYLNIINENVEISTINIIGKIKLSFSNENGIELIKDSLLNALKVVKQPKETRHINISYIGTPFYRLEIVSKDYIDAEAILSEAMEIIQANVQQYNGQFEFIRD
ncbi:MAG: S1 RNA-binding domain-containing protein [Candidatus Lokiarchaeota archaeon]|nr:S1 RNA-binding domain-containing protein [Candidatus Lokiarchaeota archaeon]